MFSWFIQVVAVVSVSFCFDCRIVFHLWKLTILDQKDVQVLMILSLIGFIRYFFFFKEA